MSQIWMVGDFDLCRVFCWVSTHKRQNLNEILGVDSPFVQDKLCKPPKVHWSKSQQFIFCSASWIFCDSPLGVLCYWNMAATCNLAIFCKRLAIPGQIFWRTPWSWTVIRGNFGNDIFQEIWLSVGSSLAAACRFYGCFLMIPVVCTQQKISLLTLSFERTHLRKTLGARFSHSKAQDK